MSGNRTILVHHVPEIVPHVVGSANGGEPLKLVLTCEICGTRLESVPPPPDSEEPG